MAELAAEAGVGGSYFTRILRLSFHAPDVVQAILRDNHPVELNASGCRTGRASRSGGKSSVSY